MDKQILASLNDSKSDLQRIQMLKHEISSINSKMQTLKNENMSIGLEKKKLESQKADIEYNLRACEYNVEILKN